MSELESKQDKDYLELAALYKEVAAENSEKEKDVLSGNACNALNRNNDEWNLKVKVTAVYSESTNVCTKTSYRDASDMINNLTERKEEQVYADYLHYRIPNRYTADYIAFRQVSPFLKYLLGLILLHDSQKSKKLYFHIDSFYSHLSSLPYTTDEYILY